MTKEQFDLYKIYLQMDKDVLAKTLAIIMSNKENISNVPNYSNIGPWDEVKYPFIFPSYKPIDLWYTTYLNN